jgi:hypothetical protein
MTTRISVTLFCGSVLRWLALSPKEFPGGEAIKDQPISLVKPL